MAEHDEKKWEVATDIARQIREKKNNIAGDFLWIGEQALNLKDDKTWMAVSESWDDFCQDREVGLGMCSSYVRNLIDVFKFYIGDNVLAVEEAIRIGPHLLAQNKAAIKKIAIADRPKAKEILLADGRISDVKRDLRELIPEEDRKPLDNEEAFLRALSKAWAKLNEVEMENVSDDFVGRVQEYLSKFNGYLLR